LRNSESDYRSVPGTLQFQIFKLQIANYFSFAPSGTSSAKVATTGFPPSTDAARVHVQVHNASLLLAQNVLVWAIYANASGHVPSLGKSASFGNAFPFWSQFGVAGGVATITPSLPGDSPWTAIGPPITLSDIDAAHPKLASWNWTVPSLPTGDPGHYCMVAFVHSADNPITETALDVDTITPRNRGIGQRNLHIGPPLPASPGPKGGPAMHEYIELHNPFAEESEFDLVFDFRSLPKQLQVRLQFTRLDTVEPCSTRLQASLRHTPATSS